MPAKSSTRSTARPFLRPGQIGDAPIGFTGRSAIKIRPVVIVAVHGNQATVRPSYTNRNRFHHVRVARSAFNGLDHDSYLSNDTRLVGVGCILNLRGYLDDHIDPFGDFNTAA